MRRLVTKKALSPVSVAFFLAASLVSILLTAWFYTASLKPKLVQFKQTHTNELTTNNQIFSNYFKHVTFVVQAFAQSKALNQALLDQNFSNPNLLELFRVVTEGNPELIQFRFLDVNGRERIRFDRDKFGGPVWRVQDAQLQEKGHRDYFQQGMIIEPGTYIWSDINLNREHGEIERPLRPTRRLMFSIAHEGERMGVLVANLSLKPIEDELFRVKKDRDIFMVNERGYYLFHTQKTYRWSEDLETQFQWMTPQKEGVIAQAIQPLTGAKNNYSLVIDARKALAKLKSDVLIQSILQGVLWALLMGMVVLGLVLRQSSLMQKKLQADLDEALENESQHKELQIRQARFATMGEMMAMLTHQWRQPLTVVMMNVDIVRSILNKQSLPPKDTEMLESRLSVIKQMLREQDNLINDFRDFSDPSKERDWFDLHHSLNASLSLLDSVLFQASVIVRTKVEPVELCGVERELQQVFMNILSNAVDVFHERKVATPMIHIKGEKRVTQHGDVYQITISDNAGGIEESILNNVFDAYLSTKSLNGSGLGLYMSQVIIRDSFAGQIRACNNESGAVFEISLPMAVRMPEVTQAE